MDIDSRLKEINSAISKIESGAQSIQIGTRRIERADLGTLYKERDKLMSMNNQSGPFGNTYVAEFHKR